MPRSSLLVALSLLAALPAHAAPAAIAVEDGWIREAPPGATVLGAYMTLRNRTRHDDRLLGVATPAAGRVEVHRMEVRAGVMRMRPAPALIVPARGATVLKPMGTHMMLMQLKRPLKAGMRVPVTLRFERAGTIECELPVKRSD